MMADDGRGHNNSSIHGHSNGLGGHVDHSHSPPTDAPTASTGTTTTTVTTFEPLSRPSSSSTQASLAQLPGISALAMGDVSGRSSPKPATPLVALASSVSGPAGNLPICQNCATSTTPLWRRDEMGSVLCNACGLFLKLHGRPRPISLKTDVIKSRNRVKTSMRPDLAMKKKNAAAVAAAAAGVDPNGVVDLQSQAYAATAALSARRTSQKSVNGHMDGDPSLGGAGMYTHASTGAYPMLDDGQYQSQHLQPFGTGASPGRAGSPVNGDRLDPQNQDQLLAVNSSLKTRVAELEVINDFIQRRLGHYEPPYGAPAGQDGHDANHQAAEAQLRSQVELLTQTETQLRGQLEESHRRENMLKRRLDELELELKESRDSLGAYESGRAKRPRLASPTDGVLGVDALVSHTTETTSDEASKDKDTIRVASTEPAGDDARRGETAKAANGIDETSVKVAQTAKQAWEEATNTAEPAKPASPKP